MTHNREWMVDAACRGKAMTNSQKYDRTFFPDRGRPALVPAHKAICSKCPVLWECLEFAIAHQLDGVWGNTTKSERDLLPAIYVVSVIHRAMKEGWYEVYPSIEKQHSLKSINSEPQEEFLFDFELEDQQTIQDISEDYEEHSVG